MIFTNFNEIIIKPMVDQLYTIDKADYSINGEKDIFIEKNNKYYFINNVTNSKPEKQDSEILRWIINRIISNKIGTNGKFIDHNTQANEFSIIDDIKYKDDHYSILSNIKYQVLFYENKYFFCFEPRVNIYNRFTIEDIVLKYKIKTDTLVNTNCLVFMEDKNTRKWVRGLILDIDKETSVQPYHLKSKTIRVSNKRVIPLLSTKNMALIHNLNKQDIISKIRKYSCISSEQKYNLTKEIFTKYIKQLFPIDTSTIALYIDTNPCIITKNIYKIDIQGNMHFLIRRPGESDVRTMNLMQGLSNVSIKEGNVIIKNIVVITTKDREQFIDNYIDSLNTSIVKGSYSFSMPVNYGIKLKLIDKVLTNSFNDYSSEIDKIYYSNEDKYKDALFILYLPLLSNYYYYLKAKLASYGYVSQVVSKDLDIYIAWNIGTNIYAKCGYEPWCITQNDKFTKADIIIGFASSLLRDENKRNIGYVNIFDKYGGWRLVHSSSEYIEFSNRMNVIPPMIQKAIGSFQKSYYTPKIIDIHYTKRFSYTERIKIYNAISDIIPDLTCVNFISIDRTHPINIYDDNNKYYLPLGTLINIHDNEYILSTIVESKAGSDQRLIKFKYWSYPKTDKDDVLSLVYRLLVMTKMNWRSVLKTSTEPVTLKYSREIAQLTNKFSLTEFTNVNTVLSRIPWFI